MGVTLNRMADNEPAVTCQGCGVDPSTARLETIPDVDDVEPVDLHVCDRCIAGLKSQMCGGTVTRGARGGKVGRRHPDQSKRAAASVESGTQQAELLAIVGWSSVGVTCAEAAGPLSTAVGHTISRNQTATRMGELVEKELVEPLKNPDGSGAKRVTGRDNEGQVWILTVAGRVESARLGR